MTIRYPGCWDKIEEMRKDRGMALPDWDDRCYIPVAGTIAIVTDGVDQKDVLAVLEMNPTHKSNDAALMAALAPWRQSKEVFIFSKEMESVLFEQADDCAVPWEALYNLPYSCIYIELQSLKDIQGVFVHFEDDANTRKRELRLTFIKNDLEVYCIPIHMTKQGNISDGINAFLEESNKFAPAGEMKELLNANLSQLKAHSNDLARKVMQLLIYLSCSNAEIEENPIQKTITKTGDGPIKDQFREIRKWDVGPEISRRIRSHYAKDSGEGSKKKPHIRASHWHHFWVGQRDSEDRELIVKWLEPIFVNSKGPVS